MNSPVSDAASSWTRLWQTGVRHSCSHGFSGNYDGEIRQFWLDRFSVLTDGDIVLDLGTGNGAITLLAKTFSMERGIYPQIHGVDLADINPVDHVPGGAELYDGISFHPSTSMASLPFADGSVRLLCSQFAFEYGPRDAAAAEILRVIGTRGCAALVMHSDDSVIAAITRAQLRGCDWLLRGSSIVQDTENLIAEMAGAGTPEARSKLGSSPSAEAARMAFNDAASQLVSRIESDPDSEILQRAAQQIPRLLATPCSNREEASAISFGLRAWIEDEDHRLRMMHAATLDRPALEAVARRFGSGGLPVRTGRLLYRESICMGWTVVVGNE
ncbi:class I SAM-dependent methyltransferase [Luteimonas saliphila]|uniref:class I SAM-dependent methyltransferase n=1 Tax=Luteimonas saliphila TaxID=2804919 RepID=UPI00192DB3A4|nr:class I SAM-dependent methyltransferase [Luteimonas saliphila]